MTIVAKIAAETHYRGLGLIVSKDTGIDLSETKNNRNFPTGSKEDVLRITIARYPVSKFLLFL